MALLIALVIRGLELLAFYVFDYLPGSERLEDNLGLSYFCLLDFSPTRGVDQMVSSCLVAGVMEHVSRPPLQHMHWRRKWQPTPVFLPGESQGRGSLLGWRLWGCTESDTI